jgi:L-threonylcarbamoyladenylate synthase
MEMLSEVMRIDQDSPDPRLLKSAVDYLEAGDVIIHPTETVYGFAGYFLKESALQKIITLKSREIQQPFSIMVNSTKEMISLCGESSEKIKRFLNRIFPEAVTILLPRKKKMALEFWNQFPYLGFRFPRHRLCNMMLEIASQPIVTTSANITGDIAPTEFNEISKRLLSQVPIAFDGGVTRRKMPSTVIQFNEKLNKLRLVREGAVPWSRIEKSFGDNE